MLRRKENKEEISPMRKRIELCKEKKEEEKEKKIREIEKKTEMLTRLNEKEGVIKLENVEIYKIGDKIKKKIIHSIYNEI